MMRVTIWSLITETGIKHNHIEEGWAEGSFPKPLSEEFTNQKAWEKMKWDKQYANSFGGYIIPEFHKYGSIR